MSGLVFGIPSGCKQCLLDWLQPVATSFSASSVLKVAIYAEVACSSVVQCEDFEQCTEDTIEVMEPALLDSLVCCVKV